jgi:hypothetical protein
VTTSFCLAKDVRTSRTSGCGPALADTLRPDISKTRHKFCSGPTSSTSEELQLQPGKT